MDAKRLREQADQLFSKKMSLLSLQQEIAENFYPQRADFTIRRYLGEEFASNLSTSYPILCHRELSGSFGTMLRSKDWFEMGLQYSNRIDHEGKTWLQWATGVQRRAMYDVKSLYSRASSEGDADFAAFGAYVKSIRLNRARDTLLYRCHHLRDCAWAEDDEGKVCPIFVKWRPTIIDLIARFPKATFDPKLIRRKEKEPFAEIQCMHMIVAAEMYDDKARGRPYFSIQYDCDHEKVIEAIPVWNKEYSVPRWQTVSGSQYPYSPAVVAALPEARLLQAMTYTLLEAGEKATNPPMVATEGAVRSDIAIYAGGTTWVDYEYDERLGDALRPMTLDKSGIPIGADMQRDSRAVLERAFFLNKLRPFSPTQDPQMTAFQAGQIVAQYIRDALPIFEPMESECNGQDCELTFDVLMRGGAFGAPQDMPKSLRGQEIQFRFQSPLHDQIEAQKGQKFLEMKQLIAEAVSLDKSAAAIPNVVDAIRDALDGIKVPAKWTRSESQVAEMRRIEEESAKAAKLLQTMQAGADVAKTVGEAASLANPAAEAMAA